MAAAATARTGPPMDAFRDASAEDEEDERMKRTRLRKTAKKKRRTKKMRQRTRLRRAKTRRVSRPWWSKWILGKRCGTPAQQKGIGDSTPSETTPDTC